MSQPPNEWDERYRQPGYWAGTEPAEFLRSVLPLLPRGAVLDVASGEGRNAVFLAKKGFYVLAAERSWPGLEKTRALAKEHGVPCAWAERLTAPPRPGAGLMLFHADLETVQLPENQFHVIVCIKYLHRPLIAQLQRALRRNGMLVYETYTMDQLKFELGPRHPEFLLNAGELRDSFAEMEILYYSEICTGKGMASLLACKR